MPQLFTNFAATTISGNITDSTTSITVVDASLMPVPSGDDFFMLVLATAVTEAVHEIVKVTARTGNNLTVVRGQEGTTPAAFNNGDKAELRETASILNSLAGMFVYVKSVGHTYTTGQAVYFDGAAWQLARSNAETTLGIGIVVVVDANNYKVYLTGQVLGLSGLTSGQYYFVSDATPGALTSTEPTDPASFSNPILFAISTTSGIVLPFRPTQVFTGDVYATNFDFMLDNEPVQFGSTYSITRTAGRITKEEWFFAGPLLAKSIDYTYSAGLVNTEVRKVFAADGVTVTAQVTITYTYSADAVQSAIYVRNI